MMQLIHNNNTHLRHSTWNLEIVLLRIKKNFRRNDTKLIIPHTQTYK
jgi:hypothetical protein